MLGLNVSMLGLNVRYKTLVWPINCVVSGYGGNSNSITAEQRSRERERRRCGSEKIEDMPSFPEPRKITVSFYFDYAFARLLHWSILNLVYFYYFVMVQWEEDITGPQKPCMAILFCIDLHANKNFFNFD